MFVYERAGLVLRNRPLAEGADSENFVYMMAADKNSEYSCILAYYLAGSHGRDERIPKVDCDAALNFYFHASNSLCGTPANSWFLAAPFKLLYIAQNGHMPELHSYQPYSRWSMIRYHHLQGKTLFVDEQSAE